MDVGSGFLAGFSGRSGSEIDALSFIFLLRDFEAATTNFRYFQEPTNDQIREVVLLNEKYTNDQKKTVSWNSTNSYTRKSSSPLFQSAATNFSQHFNFRARLFGLVRVDSKTEWELSEEARRENPVSQGISVGWDLHIVVEPGETIIGTATASCASDNVPYFSTVTISAPGSLRTIVYEEMGIFRFSVYIFNGASAKKI